MKIKNKTFRLFIFKNKVKRTKLLPLHDDMNNKAGAILPITSFSVDFIIVPVFSHANQSRQSDWRDFIFYI
ncbi:hypothetical protein, partial [Bacillus subtilis]|uniref:hypothetical protein n=2 Tax=Bacillus subtilis TaxID=1423 RepID=UPI0019D33551